MSNPKEPQPSQGAGAEERCMACIGDEFTTGHCKKCGRGRRKTIEEEHAERLGIECYIHPPDPIRGAIPTQRFTDFMSGWHIGYHRGLDVVDAQKDRRIQDLIDGRASQDARIGELQKELHRLQDDLCEKVRSEGGRLEARAEAAEKRVAELGAQLAETQVNLVRKNAELIEARERLAEAHKELATMLRERGCLSESVERLVNERDALRASLALARGSLEKIANHCGITWCLVCDDNPKHCELGEVRAVISQLPGVEKDGEGEGC